MTKRPGGNGYLAEVVSTETHYLYALNKKVQSYPGRAFDCQAREIVLAEAQITVTNETERYMTRKLAKILPRFIAALVLALMVVVLLTAKPAEAG